MLTEDIGSLSYVTLEDESAESRAVAGMTVRNKLHTKLICGESARDER